MGKVNLLKPITPRAALVFVIIGLALVAASFAIRIANVPSLYWGAIGIGSGLVIGGAIAWASTSSSLPARALQATAEIVFASWLHDDPPDDDPLISTIESFLDFVRTASPDDDPEEQLLRLRVHLASVTALAAQPGRAVAWDADLDDPTPLHQRAADLSDRFSLLPLWYTTVEPTQEFEHAQVDPGLSSDDLNSITTELADVVRVAGRFGTEKAHETLRFAYRGHLAFHIGNLSNLLDQIISRDIR